MLTTIRRTTATTILALTTAATTLVLTPSAAQAVTISPLEQQIVTATNKARTKAGCTAVRIDGRLQYATRTHSTDMARRGILTHTGSDNSTFATRDIRAGYTNPLSENIARGYTNPDTLVNAWLASPSHRRNLLNCTAKAIGVGIATNNRGSLYITQDFGRL